MPFFCMNIFSAFLMMSKLHFFSLVHTYVQSYFTLPVITGRIRSVPCLDTCTQWAVLQLNQYKSGQVSGIWLCSLLVEQELTTRIFKATGYLLILTQNSDRNDHCCHMLNAGRYSEKNWMKKLNPFSVRKFYILRYLHNDINTFQQNNFNVVNYVCYVQEAPEFCLPSSL